MSKTAAPKCPNCGATMIKTLNVDKQERGGGRIMYFCPNITNYKRVDDGFRGDPLHSHLEIYCDEKPLPKSEH